MEEATPVGHDPVGNHVSDRVMNFTDLDRGEVRGMLGDAVMEEIMRRAEGRGRWEGRV